MNKIGFSGTLDPLTNGHIWVIEEARRLADNVEIYLAENPGKKTMFPIAERKKMIETYIISRGWLNVTVHIVMNKFTARFAKNRGVEYMIRGIRNSVDFEYEDLIQDVNANMLHGCKTMFVIPPTNAGGGADGVNLGAVSSSFVKGLIGNVGWHWEVEKLIPKTHYDQIMMAWLKKEWDSAWPDDSVYHLNSRSKIDTWFNHLVAAYTGPTRHYHDLNHIVHGLSEINAWQANNRGRDDDTARLKQAFWFHDYIYGEATSTSSDEAQSCNAYRNAGLATFEWESDVSKLILATDHFQANSIVSHLKDVMLGADLAILGQNPDVYDNYTKQIAKEYLSKYTVAEYNSGRSKAMKSLLAKAEANTLYSHPYFSAEYNAMAIENMSREINDLEHGIVNFEHQN